MIALLHGKNKSWKYRMSRDFVPWKSLKEHENSFSTTQRQQLGPTESGFWAAASAVDENTVTAQTEGMDAVINEEQGQRALRGI